jgi:chromosomal replication initiator protein
MDKNKHNIHTTPQGNDEAAIKSWNQCLEVIRDNVDWRAYQTWFEPIKAVSLMHHILTIQVPSPFFYEWLEEHYVALLGKTIKRILGKEGRLEYKILMESSASQRNPTSINIPGSVQTKPSKENNFVDLPLTLDDPTHIRNPYAIPGMMRRQIDPQLNPHFTFENYVAGECNRMARGAGLDIAQKPGITSFNPFVVFGGTGWGKTHLVQAIGNEVRRLHPNKSVLYVST